MLITSLNKIYLRSPEEIHWSTLLALFGKTKPDDEELSFRQILERSSAHFALTCCQYAPEFDTIWRRYAISRARQVEHLMRSEESRTAVKVAERFVNGQCTRTELLQANVEAKIAVRKLTSTGNTYPQHSGMTAESATCLNAGLGALNAAQASVAALSCAAGVRAHNSFSWIDNDFEYQSERAGAYDAAYSAAFSEESTRQQQEFSRLLKLS